MNKIIPTFLILCAISLPAMADISDDEIIKKLDFFQNMELMKDDNYFINITLKDANKDDPLDGLEKKNEMEKKQ